jgi:hypothetical protein
MKCLIVLVLLLSANLMHAQTFRVGDKVDMYSTDGNYYAASVTEVSGSQYKIRFDGYTAANDTWVQGASLVRGGKPGDRIVVVAQQGTYYGTIEEVQNTKYKVKYDGYPESYTLTRSQFSFMSASSAPAPAQKNTPAQSTLPQSNPSVATTAGFGVGAKVQALQGSTWYAATIREIKNDKYLVKYDNYNEEEWVSRERLRAKPTLTADKLKATSGKTYVRSIRWIATGSTEISWYFLGDNGVIVVDPVHGLNPVNMAAEQADNFKNIGYYTIANNQINIKWLSGKTTTLGLKYKNGEIIEMDAGGIMVRQKGLPENYKLSGTYKGSISYGTVASSSSYTFTRDGRVTRTQAGYASTADASGRANNTKSGSYTIKGTTLFVTYTDGTRETANIGVFSGDQLVLNGNWMSAQ